MTQQGRTSDGKFARGNPGGPGRKPKEFEQEYLQRMEAIVGGANWEAIVNKAVEDAIVGVPSARMWLSGYLLGMPVQRTEAPPEDAFSSILTAIRSRRLSEGEATPPALTDGGSGEEE